MAHSCIQSRCCRRQPMQQGSPPSHLCRQVHLWSQCHSTFFLLPSDTISPIDLFNPQFLVWDPQCLFKDLRCPHCCITLYRHGVISRSRRCVGMDMPFWIIGYRYCCSECKHPKTGKTTVTWHSWDRRILAALPPTLATKFSVLFTHCTGISNPNPNPLHRILKHHLFVDVFLHPKQNGCEANLGCPLCSAPPSL